MALANILMIGLLLRVFYEDIKDRKVTFIVLVILLLLGGFIHSQHQNLWVFFLSSLLNTLPANTRIITCEEVFELKIICGR